MAIRKSQQKCVNKYIANNYDRINLTIPKGEKERIKMVAEQNGESVNALINRILFAEVERIEAVGFGISSAKNNTNK